MRADKEGGQSKHEAIERSEIWGALSGTIGDEQLLLEQQRLGGNGTGAPGRSNFAKVTSRWIARSSSSRMDRTVSH